MELAARLVPAEAGSLLLDDPRDVRRGASSPLVFIAAFGAASERLVGMKVPAGRGIVGHVYRSGERYSTAKPSRDPYFFARVDELAAFRTRSVVAAPVYIDQQVVGVFELVNARGRPAFTRRDLDLVELLSGYISRALLNAVDVVRQNELALFDELTGTRHVRGLEPFLDREIRRVERGGLDLAVIFVDVDRLKRINDSIGHRMGSEALKRVGAALVDAVGPHGVVFRFGGDEFVVVCPGAEMADARAIAASLGEAVVVRTEGPTADGGRLPPISISLGIATLGRSLSTRAHAKREAIRKGARLLAAADRALYRAKATGRARVAAATKRDDTLGT